MKINKVLQLILRLAIAIALTFPALVFFIIYAVIELSIDGDISKHDTAGTIASWWCNWISIGVIDRW